MKKIPREVLISWVEGLLKGVGVPPAQASEAGDIFLRAHRRGVGHHDLSFLPQRLDWIRSRGVNPAPRMERLLQTPSAEVWDGDEGLGEIACRHITYRAMDLARSSGVGYATVRRSNHFLAAAPYAEIGASQGFLLMVFSNTDPCMATPGGTHNLIGNDPMGYGIGRGDEPPVIFDVCMAYSSLGNLRALAAEGKSVPEYWGTDALGRPTTDPQALLNGGAVAPMARHKGFGLALMTEMLTGILAGGATGDQVAPGGGINTHNQAVLAFDLKYFGGREAVEGRVADLADRLKGREPGLRLPGERAYHALEEAETQGYPLADGVYQEFLKWSDLLGVPVPRV